MEKITFDDLYNRTDWQEAVIVIDNVSFDKEYPLESRSYVVSRNANYFRSGLISKSLIGSSLDGTDMYVRLDWYLFVEWKVEYCYILK